MSEMLNRVAAFGADNGACGTADPAETPASACGSACGATDPASACGSACGASDPDKK
ncbi:MAG: hypothetical protein K2K06_02360 [Oscillospiraceae bacterium]|nr:hypothetical protein [Oscillospiraceae bacterium]MDE6706863.1 hypothetical protein [Oscillospiraceae bacterium]